MMTMNQKHPTLNEKLGGVYFGTVPKVCVQAPLENSEISSSKTGRDLFVAGLCAAVGKTAVAPIERVKLLIQNQDGLVKNDRLTKPYQGVRHCVRQVIREEGALSLWRGNFPSIMGCFPTQVLNLGFNTLFRRQTNFQDETHGYWWWLVRNFACGGAAGASSLLFVYPLEYARTRLATDLKVVDPMFGDRKFKNLADLYIRTLESDGVAGLYRGFGPSCVGVTLYRSLYFGLYESLKPVVLTGKMQDNTSATFALASGVSFIAGLTSYPLDTASRRMMITSTEAFEFKHSLHSFNYIMKKEGAKSLYKGASVNILRAIAGGCVLFCFDKLEFNLYPLAI
ncbi:ADP,ATP carrier protein 1, mitochondrial [Artemisia annua]|uniref:ADP/ATP translocase n=1 Tax=Artemisia annua TaxID=35608 RepID=A0A2U1KFE7_ARTAN|nr:ADP,ATP carrier protein 1, mitochondrial [Artemisia annua]